MNYLAPSILSADFMHLQEQIDAVTRGGAQYLHFDIMDGVFVPAISFGMPVLKCVRRACALVLDVHLMIVEPERYISEFAALGTDILTVHYEAAKDVKTALRQIRDAGMKAGLAINPETEAEKIREYLPLMDQITVMTVHPGRGGQVCIPECVDKLRQVAAYIREDGLQTDIEVDGGVKTDNLAEIRKAGANVIVAGSAIFAGDVQKQTEYFCSRL
ncbi:MAG: ribulose-phosphate 3-epimerase [Lachnospiraceae bacterium]|nr:ribulose-phosphate 3-epimerase [Lachnospiraceae bacterium]